MSTTGSRFDLEQKIIRCWNVVDDLELFEKMILERSTTDDDKANFILGLKTIYSAKFEDLWEEFEACLKHKQI